MSSKLVFTLKAIRVEFLQNKLNNFQDSFLNSYIQKINYNMLKGYINQYFKKQNHKNKEN